MPTLTPDITNRIRPGWMAKETDRAGRWFLYDPVTDSGCTFALDRPDAGEMCPADLDSDDRAWAGGALRTDIYHAAHALRRHRDGRESNLEINYLCRYACRHCFQSLRPADHADATPDLASLRAAVERLLAAGAAEISITGGDIFLHPDLDAFLDFLHDRAPLVTLRLLVNGGGFDPKQDAARLLRLAGRRVILKSDFFGHKPELHDAFTRVPGSFLRLVEIVRLARSAGIACLPTAALTRANFETRFELVNFLDALSEDNFTVSSIIYPTDHRRAEALAELRLLPEQYGELMEERFFAPLAAEYHTFEPQCAGDCQFAVASAAGPAWGCSFLKLSTSAAELPLLDAVAAWRTDAVSRATFHECPTCPARSTCRKCPSFLSSGATGDAYCAPSRLAAARVGLRVRQALGEGFAFAHPEAAARAPISVPVPAAGVAP